MKHGTMCLCVMLLTVALAKTSVAQSIDSLKARYDNELLHSYNGYLSKGQNGDRIRFRQFKNEFQVSPEGLNLFQDAKKQNTKSLIFLSAALGCIISGAIVENNGNKNLAAGLMISGLTFDIIGLVYSVKAQKKFSRAVWVRNRDVLFSPK